MAGSPIALQCELSDPNGQEVSRHNDGTELLPGNKIEIQSQEILRSLEVPSTEQTHSDVCSSESKEDDVEISVDVKGDVHKLIGTLSCLAQD